jgi:hypothetical protein
MGVEKRVVSEGVKFHIFGAEEDHWRVLRESWWLPHSFGKQPFGSYLVAYDLL